MFIALAAEIPLGTAENERADWDDLFAAANAPTPIAINKPAPSEVANATLLRFEFDLMSYLLS
jgi:hypothetical protein